jgi:gluconokinase
LAKGEREYKIYMPEQFFREQKPDEIFEAVLSSLKVCIQQSNINTADIGFVSFSAVMHSLIAVDKAGNPLTDSIIWADTRSASYTEEYKHNGKGLEIYFRTGTPIHPMSPLYKLMWLRDNRNGIFKNAHKFISIKEYIFYKLFGEYIVDYSIASATGMFDIFALQWDREALDILGLNEDRLSKPVPTTYCIRNLKNSYCEFTGLNQSTIFVIGASDGCLANLGSNALKPGTAAVSIGTSGAVRVTFDKPVTDAKGRVFCYILSKDKYVVGGPINNGGVIYRWFRDNLAVSGSKYPLINEAVRNIKPGSDGLIFLPFLMGERAPYWDADLRGGFLGISDMHNRNHFARAVIEGICFDLNDVLQAIREQVGHVEKIMASGGFTAFDEWIQMLSSIMDINIEVQENTESSCLGAVMLGMLATRMVAKLEDCVGMVKSCEVYKPRNNEKEIYERLFGIYRETIEQLTPTLRKLAEFQRNN